MLNKIEMNLSENSSKNTNDSNFENFLLSEYDSISQAHFNTVNTISAFFKYYLLVISLPFPIFAFLTNLSNTQGLGALLNLLEKADLIFPIAATAIALVGLCVMIYISNLRLDAILYARNINGIRKYFYKKSGLSFDEENNIRVLPKNIFVPHYCEYSYFLFVIIAFIILDSLYFIFGWVGWDYWHYKSQGILFSKSILLLLGLILFVVCICIHYIAYRRLTDYRENNYLLCRAIGVDMDGVLNQHRQHFCKLAKKLLNKDINPDNIKKIPVRECKGLGLNIDDEFKIFNTIEYWTDLPAREEVKAVIKQIRSYLKYKIIIYTQRDWPNVDLETFSENYKNKILGQWKGKDIAKITQKWLRLNGIKYNKLIVENNYKKGNRFVDAQRGMIRFFVEDDLMKAKRLANYCDLIFLIRQPYNRKETNEENISKNWKEIGDSEVPKNVLYVDGWNDIFKYIKELN